MILFSSKTMISLSQLLSTCMDASKQGCDVIRNFYYEQQKLQDGNGGGSGNIVSGTLKEVGNIKSVVTQADIDAQAVIVGGLRNAWGDKLLIVGEEDEEDATPNMNIRLNKNLLVEDLIKGENSNNNDDDDDIIPMDEIALFVDPLDGTREFVEGRLQNVACLIGIARNQKSIGGVVGLPFPDGKQEDASDIKKNNAVVYYAIADPSSSCNGIWPNPTEQTTSDTAAAATTTTTTTTTSPSSPCPPTVFTGDSTNPILVNATACAVNLCKQQDKSVSPNHIILGGSAAKLRAVATTPNSITISHFSTKLWDTCSPEAIINNKGGLITDLFGSPLVHSPKHNYPSYGNIFGYVASSGDTPSITKVHMDLCATMRADYESVSRLFCPYMGESTIIEPQALDVARDLDGQPLHVKWIEKQILSTIEQDNDTTMPTLQSYTVPESGVWRGLMSTGGRLVLNWNNNDENNNNKVKLPKSAFYKRVVMADLAHTRTKLANTPHKVVRDVKSYQVETAFLTSKACQIGLIQQAGIHINKVYGSDLRPSKHAKSPKEQIESRFAILLEDFQSSFHDDDDTDISPKTKGGWEQEWLLDEKAAKAALRAFARLHAYFWTGSRFWKKGVDGKNADKDCNELENSVWSNGGYMQLDLQGYDQLTKVATGYTNRLPTFQDDLKQIPELEKIDITTIGERLEQIAKDVGTKAHPFYNTDKDAKDKNEGLYKYRTIIHGDPKQANIFLRPAQGNNNDDKKGTLEVGLIDFQWSGFGLAATEVAHFISAALQPSCISYDGSTENELLNHYYSCLSKALIEFEVAKDEQDIEQRVFPRSVFQDQYETALLDIGRMVFAYAWARWKQEDVPTPESLNRNAYNKSRINALWLITRCAVLLSARDMK